MEENERQEQGGRAEYGGQKSAKAKRGAKKSALVTAKEFSASSRFALPRAVFMLMIFCFLSAFFSSLMTGLAATAASVFAGLSGGERFAAPAFLLVELFSLAILFVLHYGLFLCNLRFVRNQPVALSFLFAGIRQRRARTGAAFFVLPMLLCMAAFAAISSGVEFFSLPALQSPDALMEYIKNNPDSMRTFLACFVLFLLLAFVFYAPFTFVWSFVYDAAGRGFWPSLLRGVKFFFARFFHFLAFAFFCHFRKVFWIFALNALHALAYQKSQAGALSYSLASLLGFVSFALSFYAAASVILSIQYYYDRFSDESSHKKNSK